MKDESEEFQNHFAADSRVLRVFKFRADTPGQQDVRQHLLPEDGFLGVFVAVDDFAAQVGEFDVAAFDLHEAEQLGGFGDRHQVIQFEAQRFAELVDVDPGFPAR